MPQNLSQPSGQLIKSLHQKMVKRRLFQKSFEMSELYCALKKFVQNDLAQHISWADMNSLNMCVAAVMKNLQQEMGKQKILVRVWMKVFIVHAVFMLTIKKNIEIEAEILFSYLVEQLKNCRLQLISKPLLLAQSPSSDGLISRSLSKIKRSISTSSIKRLFGSSFMKQQVKNQIKNTSILKDWENKKVTLGQIQPYFTTPGESCVNVLKDAEQTSTRINKTRQPHVKLQTKILQQREKQRRNEQRYHQKINNSQQNGIEKALQEILQQYIKYLQKLISDWPSLQISLSSYIVDPQTLYKSQVPRKQKNQQLFISRQIAWKLFNYFHILGRICNNFHKICQLLKEQETFMYAVLNFLTEDVQFLYSPLVDFIFAELQSIRWEEIIKIIGSNKEKRSLQKYSFSSYGSNSQQMKKKLPDYVSQHVLELKSMIDELGNANQVVLYIFSGYKHSKNLHNRKRPKSFISINDHKFDIVFQMAKRIQQKQSKNNLLKSGLMGRRQIVLNGLENNRNKSLQLSLKVKENPQLDIPKQIFFVLNTIKKNQNVNNQKKDIENVGLIDRKNYLIPEQKVQNQKQSEINMNKNMGAVKYKAKKLNEMKIKT